MRRRRDHTEAPGERSTDWDTAFVRDRVRTAKSSGPRSDTPPAPAGRSGTATSGSQPLERGAVATLPDSGARPFRYAGRNGDGMLRFEPVAWTDAVASVSVGEGRFRADVERGAARVEPSLSSGRRMAAELAALGARIRAALTPPEKGDVPHWMTR